MTRRPGRPPADRGRIAAAYRAGRPVAWICSRLGVSRAAVYLILARAGVERDRSPRRPRGPPARGSDNGAYVQSDRVATMGGIMAFAVTIICDGDGCDAEVVGPRPVTGLRRDFEDLRELAARSGWRRFRPRGADGNGDYCRACAAELEAKRP